MISVPALEWNVSRACNLSCKGCLTLSDFPHTEVFSKETIKQWYLPWCNKIAPKNLAILGGEPLLNKEIIDIILMTKEMWNSEYTEYFELITNGFLLYKYPDLPKVLFDCNCVLVISVHGDSPAYQKKVKEMEDIVKNWEATYKIQVKWHVDDKEKGLEWNRVFRGDGLDIRPHEDNNIESSWKNCPTGQTCFQLYKKNIYKCPLPAYLPEHKEKFGLHKSFDKYLDSYKPLRPGSTDTEIIEFFSRKAECICNICPAKPILLDKPDPIKRKKEFKVKINETNKISKRKK